MKHPHTSQAEIWLTNTTNIRILSYWIFGTVLVLLGIIILSQWEALSSDEMEIDFGLSRLDAFITIILMTFGGLVLTQVWIKWADHAKKRGQNIRKDVGLLFLAGALFCWIISKFIGLYYNLFWANDPVQLNIPPSILICSFFLLNSWCILQGLHYFEHNKILYNNFVISLLKRLKILNITQANYPKHVNYLCGIFGFLMLIAICTTTGENKLAAATKPFLPLDLLITTPLLFLVLDETYNKRGLSILRVLNIFFGFSILVSQIFAIPFAFSVFISVLLMLSMKVVFVISFVSIAFSWNFGELEKS